MSMQTIPSIGDRITHQRKAIGLSQTRLAQKARISRATLDALENGRLGEIGFAKLTNILTALGLELTLQPATSGRPTLEDLMHEHSDEPIR